jgi:hypothetical protein
MLTANAAVGLTEDAGLLYDHSGRWPMLPSCSSQVQHADMLGGKRTCGGAAEQLQQLARADIRSPRSILGPRPTWRAGNSCSLPGWFRSACRCGLEEYSTRLAVLEHGYVFELKKCD